MGIIGFSKLRGSSLDSLRISCTNVSRVNIMDWRSITTYVFGCFAKARGTSVDPFSPQSHYAVQKLSLQGVGWEILEPRALGAHGWKFVGDLKIKRLRHGLARLIPVRLLGYSKYCHVREHRLNFVSFCDNLSTVLGRSSYNFHVVSTCVFCRCSFILENLYVS